MPRTKEQYEAMREATRNKIHSAAVKLFSKKGLAGTGVQEIADEAGISVGLLYRHYKTKDDIFGALVKEASDGLGEVGKLFESEMAPTQAIQMFAAEYINDITFNDEFVQYMMLLSEPVFMNKDFPWVENLMKSNNVLRRQLVKLIERGQKEGTFREGNPNSMATHYFAVMQGVCMMKHVEKEKYIPPTVEMLTAYLLKEKENDE